MLAKVHDCNELSLLGLKMKPEIKLSFAFNLLSSRHNLARLETFRYLLFHLLNPSILQLSVSVYLKLAQKIRWLNHHQPCFNLNSIFLMSSTTNISSYIMIINKSGSCNEAIVLRGNMRVSISSANHVILLLVGNYYRCILEENKII